MKSIRLYLLLALLATITLVNFVSLLHGYNASMQKAQQLFDNRLDNTAKLLASANARQAQPTPVTEQDTSNIYFQIWNDATTNLLSRSQNAPEMLLGDKTTGFHEVNHDRYRWRQYLYRDVHLNRWIVVAERMDIRYSLAEEVVLESLLPIIMAIPVSALIIWLAVGVGLKPLREFAEQVKRKKADDLSPIRLEQVPAELKPVVMNTNALLLRLEEAFAREQRFSADAAHELRTPISVLNVHLHNVIKRIGQQDEDINLLKEGIERMGHLVEQILALYRTSPDQALMKFESLELMHIAQDVIARDYEQFESKQQRIDLDAEPGMMQGNQFALETLLDNLLMNACKYTPEGGQIHVEIMDTGNTIKLSVEDSGPGIPPQHYQRVFERFYRLHGDQHHSGVIGCGLGLTIVKHITELHHASISLGPSRFEQGLRVLVVFPKEVTQ